MGATIAAIFEAVAEEHLTQPTIIYEFPTAISPLSKQKPDEPEWTERWEIYAGQMEISNGFSELNDPEDQRRRFEAQLQERERGDEEAHQMDEDYIRALSYGMPPAGGVGVGVDRLCMLLTDSHTIRDVILFPLLRPEKGSTTEDTGETQEKALTAWRLRSLVLSFRVLTSPVPYYALGLVQSRFYTFLISLGSSRAALP